jgi:hypothetical protein
MLSSMTTQAHCATDEIENCDNNPNSWTEHGTKMKTMEAPPQEVAETCGQPTLNIGELGEALRSLKPS